ncbi:hypothetical protein QR680_013280 [Steinernema hermaphroditum]|uniref:Uncharacterized protein n=1 Tax=Steinernema hermaphroditum TaxID=289476 RepID=A0AA39M216_9BILA|nr:hypothetical protein QR680_007237 [Steinernema hermaphroditum]KAK0417918.1 hypothetical protein QR680_013280 [Steinernema hermaphroditum]
MTGVIESGVDCDSLFAERKRNCEHRVRKACRFFTCAILLIFPIICIWLGARSLWLSHHEINNCTDGTISYYFKNLGFKEVDSDLIAAVRRACERGERYPLFHTGRRS